MINIAVTKKITTENNGKKRKQEKITLTFSKTQLKSEKSSKENNLNKEKKSIKSIKTCDHASSVPPIKFNKEYYNMPVVCRRHYRSSDNKTTSSSKKKISRKCREPIWRDIFRENAKREKIKLIELKKQSTVKNVPKKHNRSNNDLKKFNQLYKFYADDKTSEDRSHSDNQNFHISSKLLKSLKKSLLVSSNTDKGINGFCLKETLFNHKKSELLTKATQTKTNNNKVNIGKNNVNEFQSSFSKYQKENSSAKLISNKILNGTQTFDLISESQETKNLNENQRRNSKLTQNPELFSNETQTVKNFTESNHNVLKPVSQKLKKTGHFNNKESGKISTDSSEKSLYKSVSSSSRNELFLNLRPSSVDRFSNKSATENGNYKESRQTDGKQLFSRNHNVNRENILKRSSLFAITENGSSAREDYKSNKSDLTQELLKRQTDEQKHLSRNDNVNSENFSKGSSQLIATEISSSARENSNSNISEPTQELLKRQTNKKNFSRNDNVNNENISKGSSLLIISENGSAARENYKSNISELTQELLKRQTDEQTHLSRNDNVNSENFSKGSSQLVIVTTEISSSARENYNSNISEPTQELLKRQTNEKQNFSRNDNVNNENISKGSSLLIISENGSAARENYKSNISELTQDLLKRQTDERKHLSRNDNVNSEHFSKGSSQLIATEISSSARENSNSNISEPTQELLKRQTNEKQHFSRNDNVSNENISKGSSLLITSKYGSAAREDYNSNISEPTQELAKETSKRLLKGNKNFDNKKDYDDDKMLNQHLHNSRNLGYSILELLTLKGNSQNDSNKDENLSKVSNKSKEFMVEKISHTSMTDNRSQFSTLEKDEKERTKLLESENDSTKNKSLENSSIKNSQLNENLSLLPHSEIRTPDNILPENVSNISFVISTQTYHNDLSPTVNFHSLFNNIKSVEGKRSNKKIFNPLNDKNADAANSSSYLSCKDTDQLFNSLRLPSGSSVLNNEEKLSNNLDIGSTLISFHKPDDDLKSAGAGYELSQKISNPSTQRSHSVGLTTSADHNNVPLFVKEKDDKYFSDVGSVQSSENESITDGNKYSDVIDHEINTNNKDVLHEEVTFLDTATQLKAFKITCTAEKVKKPQNISEIFKILESSNNIKKHSCPCCMKSRFERLQKLLLENNREEVIVFCRTARLWRSTSGNHIIKVERIVK